MIIYSHTLTPRLHYVVNFISEYFQHPFKLTANELAYAASPDFKLNYSHQKIDARELYISPQALLFETEKRPVTVKCVQHNGHTVFFEASGDLHFDLFAAIFFLLSRYEEYLPHEKDKYGLYNYQNSTAFKEEFLHLPLVNIWLEDFRQLLLQKFEGLQLPANTFQLLPTYDIDVAWCYKHKSFKIHNGQLLRSILQGKWKKAMERIRVVKGKQKDPYESYEWMDDLHHRFDLHPIYFLLVAAEKGKFDKNPDVSIPEFQHLIKHISTKYKTGLHPSWHSGDHKQLLVKEKKWLEDVTHHTIHASRQHFLRFQLPHTFQQLQSAGIQHEYSMGYGTINGFRASIASPFFWYDLEKEEATTLRVYPFCFMDANSFYEQGLSAEQAFEELMNYYATIKSVNGLMITIWHNNFLGTAEEFSGWKEAYEKFIENVCKEAK